VREIVFGKESIVQKMSSPALLLADDASRVASTGATIHTDGTPITAVGSSSGINHVIIHASVLFHILDHHTRRNDVSGRVIGTLLGRRLDGTTIAEVTNAFAVPHAERGDEVAIGKDYNKKMLNLCKRASNAGANNSNNNNNNTVNPGSSGSGTTTKKDNAVIGWYATSAASDNPAAPLITDTSSLIHDFYAGESDEDEPIHLVVDTRLQLQPEDTGPAIAIKAYKSSPVVLQGEHMGNVFHEIRVTYQCSDAESICLYEMMKALGYTIKNEQLDTSNHVRGDSTAGLQKSLQRLCDEINTTLEYVNAAIKDNGTNKIDPEIGRQIADTLATVPKIRPDVFDSLFHNSLQDLLTVSYLSNLVRTQVTIAEKLNASLGI
jgi:translation initiation factor 3 subunit F